MKHTNLYYVMTPAITDYFGYGEPEPPYRYVFEIETFTKSDAIALITQYDEFKKVRKEFSGQNPLSILTIEEQSLICDHGKCLGYCCGNTKCQSCEFESLQWCKDSTEGLEFY